MVIIFTIKYSECQENNEKDQARENNSLRNKEDDKVLNLLIDLFTF